MPDGPDKTNGIAVGDVADYQLLAARARGGFDADVPYVQPPPGPGVFKPVAPTPPVDIKLKQGGSLLVVNHPEYPPVHATFVAAVTASDYVALRPSAH
ncbi:MAG: hypothetical protein A2V77_00930 [Anaeromyxobacter sp. RBG_16_69_14]|nr:MAG: hypothetical protein A2V77_00930 [Anaeromyxobacter sp. RBG_16_69_14]